MGLSSGLHDVAGAAPLPPLLLVSLASLLSVVSFFFPGDLQGAGDRPKRNTTTTTTSVRRSSAGAGLTALLLTDYPARPASCYVSTADDVSAAATARSAVCMSVIASRREGPSTPPASTTAGSTRSSSLCPADDDNRRRRAGEDAAVSPRGSSPPFLSTRAARVAP
ncbi:hypothetical protein BS78_K047600 [Paspalum vaginatum]|uniref:Uncharacterized protein n=1 Tax=Paspalum vaginatum TaxID=158149 RepID=A0A9W8CFK8_9POAL|nr:hypothetical protein BS78_K047600 [Paspalum vaginatum]